MLFFHNTVVTYHHIVKVIHLYTHYFHRQQNLSTTNTVPKNIICDVVMIFFFLHFIVCDAVTIKQFHYTIMFHFFFLFLIPILYITLNIHLHAQKYFGKLMQYNDCNSIYTNKKVLYKLLEASV